MCELNTFPLQTVMALNVSKNWQTALLPAAEACPAPAAAHLSCTGNPVALIQLWVISSSVSNAQSGCFLPCHCLQCSGMSWMQLRWCLVGCCRLPDCLRLHLPPCKNTQHNQDECQGVNVNGLTDEVNNHLLHISYHSISSVYPSGLHSNLGSNQLTAGTSSKCTRGTFTGLYVCGSL